jgi:hypothetical protein
MRRVTGFEAQLWRALRVFRVATLVYAVILIGKDVGVYRYPVAAWVVAGVMTGWTAVSVVLYGRRPGRPWPLLIADLAIMIGCLVATVPVTGLDSLAHSHTLPSVAVAGAVLAWAVGVGRMGAIVSSLLVGVIDVGIRGQVNQNTLNSAVVLVLAAVGIGYVADLGPDNITVSPYGGVILAEDGDGIQHLVGVTDQGKAYALARNDLNDSEFTGPAFSADGLILFACIQSP